MATTSRLLLFYAACHPPALVRRGCWYFVNSACSCSRRCYLVNAACSCNRGWYLVNSAYSCKCCWYLMNSACSCDCDIGVQLHSSLVPHELRVQLLLWIRRVAEFVAGKSWTRHAAAFVAGTLWIRHAAAFVYEPFVQLRSSLVPRELGVKLRLWMRRAAAFVACTSWTRYAAACVAAVTSWIWRAAALMAGSSKIEKEYFNCIIVNTTNIVKLQRHNLQNKDVS